MSIEKIVLTGGPCGGKSTALCEIEEDLTKLGYKVFIIAESATELMAGGFSPVSLKGFQNYLTKYQMEKEELYEQAAREYGGKVVIVCDRGLLDNKAYMSESQFQSVLKSVGLSEVTARDNYGAVFQLVTTAKGAEEYYRNKDNKDSTNKFRSEDLDGARKLDDRMINAWTGHPHFRVIDNSTDFKTKIHRLLVEIRSYLGEPMPFEIERKFMIEYPDIKWLESLPNVQKVDIIQTYLKVDNGEETRIRQRGLNGDYVYTMTTKRAITDIKRVEEETHISQREYLALLMNADTTKRQIRKTRYCMTYENSYLEIDVFPDAKNWAILEVELTDENDPIFIPDQIKVLKEVTSDLRMRNSSLAENGTRGL